MKDLIIHVVISALLLALVDHFVDGVTIAGFGYALLAALVLGVCNTLIRPILVLVTLPITILTLGLFLFVVNALVLLLVAAIVPGFAIDGLGAAILAALLLTLFNYVASSLLHKRK